MYKSSVIVAAFLAAISGPAAADAAMDELIKPCVGCHGVDGVGSSSKIPYINWQLPKYLIDAMVVFQEGGRITAVPKHIPKTWTKDELKKVAEHFGNNRAPRSRQPANTAKVARGETVHNDRCASCHEDNGRATDTKGGTSPILAGQSVEFLTAQSAMYLAGKRKFSSPQFKDSYNGLSEADAEAVSHFYASQDVVPPPEDKKRKRR
jgi:cytochrome c553